MKECQTVAGSQHGAYAPAHQPKDPDGNNHSDFTVLEIFTYRTVSYVTACILLLFLTCSEHCCCKASTRPRPWCGLLIPPAPTQPSWRWASPKCHWQDKFDTRCCQTSLRDQAQHFSITSSAWEMLTVPWACRNAGQGQVSLEFWAWSSLWWEMGNTGVYRLARRRAPSRSLLRSAQSFSSAPRALLLADELSTDLGKEPPASPSRLWAASPFLSYPTLLTGAARPRRRDL